jgi:hypothetical protein
MLPNRETKIDIHITDPSVISLIGKFPLVLFVEVASFVLEFILILEVKCPLVLVPVILPFLPILLLPALRVLTVGVLTVLLLAVGVELTVLLLALLGFLVLLEFLLVLLFGILWRNFFGRWLLGFFLIAGIVVNIVSSLTFTFILILIIFGFSFFGISFGHLRNGCRFGVWVFKFFGLFFFFFFIVKFRLSLNVAFIKIGFEVTDYVDRSFAFYVKFRLIVDRDEYLRDILIHGPGEMRDHNFLPFFLDINLRFLHYRVHTSAEGARIILVRHRTGRQLGLVF